MAEDVNVVSLVQSGFTLRDYFAGQALSAMPVYSPGYQMGTGNFNEQDAATLSRNCYAIADAMLAEREK